MARQMATTAGMNNSSSKAAQMVANPQQYFAAARERARKEAEASIKRERELKRRHGKA